MDGLERLAEALGIDAQRHARRRPSASCTAPRWRPTRCSSARGRRLGLLTTEGHRDVLEMREGLKDDRYDLRQPPPEPLVPRELRFGVHERIRADGRIETPLEPQALDAAIEALQRAEVEFGRGLLPARLARRPARAAGRRGAARAHARGACLAVLARCCRRSRNMSGSRTTVVNAYVGPALARYLGRLETRLREAGFAGPILIMQSHGGVATIADSVRLAAGAVLSGPAGGVAGGPARDRPARPARSRAVRHGRHQHRRLAGRGRPCTGRLGPQTGRPAGRAASPSTS